MVGTSRASHATDAPRFARRRITAVDTLTCGPSPPPGPREGRKPMIIDGFVQQLPDTDPTETDEWMQSLDAVVAQHGVARARYLVSKLLVRARELQVGVP